MKTDTAHEKWNETWQTEDGRQNWLEPEPRVLACAARLRLRGAKTALDLGCGVGRHAIALASLGFETTALDASTAGLEELRKSAARRDLQVDARQGLMTELPFEAESFDFVLSHNVIYHGDRTVVERAILEIGRVLKPGGTFQGTMLSKRRPEYGLGVEISTDTFIQPDGPGDKVHPHFYCDAAGVVALFSGFEILSLEDVGDDGKWHWYLVAERT